MHLADHLIKIALKEDIGSGDVTTDTLIDASLKGQAVIIAREPLVAYGIEVVSRVFNYLDPDLNITPLCWEGKAVNPNDIMLELNGRVKSLLLGERTALNFLQRLSGIATHVNSFVKELGDRNVRLVDTRKTTPGWRVLEKAAVRAGGAFNHRMGLFDGILIKDNHIAACGGIIKAVNRIKKKMPHLLKIEVEAASLLEVKDALTAGADIIMLDNMDVDRIKEAVAVIDGQALVEVSGGITKQNLLPLADTGVDIISSGALTHSARAVDISMRISPIT